MFYRSSNEQAFFPAPRLTLTHHEAWPPNLNYHRTNSIRNMSSSTMNSNLDAVKIELHVVKSLLETSPGEYSTEISFRSWKPDPVARDLLARLSAYIHSGSRSQRRKTP